MRGFSYGWAVAFAAASVGHCLGDIVIDPDGVGAVDVRRGGGVLLVNPLPSSLNLNGMIIGRDGPGALLVDGGSVLQLGGFQASGLSMSTGSPGDAELIVRGEGSLVTTTRLFAGSFAESVIRVEDGGALELTSASRVGLGAEGTTLIRIDGPGSSGFAFDLLLGQGGLGRLEVVNGASFELTDAPGLGLFLGDGFGALANSRGEVLVEGPGSRVFAGGRFDMGTRLLTPAPADVVVVRGGLLEAREATSYEAAVLTFGVSGRDDADAIGRFAFRELTINGSGLRVELLDAFVPVAGDRFDIMDGTITGTFGTITASALDDGLRWDFSSLYRDGEVGVIEDLPVQAFAVPTDRFTFADVVAFLRDFDAGGPLGDLAPPFGEFTMADLTEFMHQAMSCCP
jgi:hypothetical protein